MRQFFSWRIWAAFGALIGLVLLLKVVLPANAATPAQDTGPTPRNVDFIALVYAVQPSPNFVVRNGYVTGSADLIIDGQRTMHITEGTLGEVTCDKMDEIGQCVVFADLLGEAVVWFAIVPLETGLRANVAPIVELLDDNIAQLENGWLVRMATSVERQCNAEDTASLREFLDLYGPGSTTVVDVARQRITVVRCAADAGSPETTTTVPIPTTVPGSATIPPDTTTIPPADPNAATSTSPPIPEE